MTTKILVVEEGLDLRLLINKKFRKKIFNKEYEFIFTSNGKEALRKLEQIDDLGIIITDINVPDIDGLPLLSHLQNLDRPYRAIIVSALGDMPHIRTAMNNGAADFITKPIDLQDLETTIENIAFQYLHLKEDIATKERLSDIEKELDIARIIQQAMLPQSNEIFRSFDNRFELLGTVLPAKQIGGDFFDFFQLDSQRVGLIIADVSGKSISASLYMAITKTLFRAVARTCNTCNEALEKVNKLLSPDNPTCMFVTAFYGILNVVTGTLEYSNAGHTHPYIISNHKLLKISEGGNSIPLGVDENLIIDDNLNFIQQTVTLKDNDCLFLYTDGVTEAMNSDNQFYTSRRLEKILLQNSLAPLEKLISAVVDDLKFFTKDVEQSDDIALFCLRYHAQIKSLPAASSSNLVHIG